MLSENCKAQLGRSGSWWLQGRSYHYLPLAFSNPIQFGVAAHRSGFI
jgi:hypothetical protein